MCYARSATVGVLGREPAHNRRMLQLASGRPVWFVAGVIDPGYREQLTAFMLSKSFSTTDTCSRFVLRSSSGW